MDVARPRRALFRVDVSAAIGTGHAVRCVALAGELARHGHEPWFASRDPDGSAAGWFGGDAGRLIQLDADDVDEVAAIRQVVPRSGQRRGFAALILDHYGLGEAWLGAARTLATRCLVIDDLADRRLPCDVLLNQTLGATAADYRGLVGRGTLLLLGPRFALLRGAFRAAGQRRPRVNGTVDRVLVMMGGSDPSGVTAAAVDAVRVALPDAAIDVVLGALYRGTRHFGSNVVVHEAIGESEMARLMAEADLAVGAGGTSAWERCAVGLPAVVLRLADNQDEMASRLDRAGAVVDAGPAERLGTTTLANLVARLASDPDRRQTMSRSATSLVDGRGVERVAHAIDPVRMRRAGTRDAQLLWAWANDPGTRAASFHSDPIPYPDHERWLRARLDDPRCLLLIGENGAGALGQVRFDARDDAVELSISVAPEHRGTVGRLLLSAAVRRAQRWAPGATFVARVKAENEPSRRLFEAAGFRLVSERQGVLRYDSVPTQRPVRSGMAT